MCKVLLAQAKRKVGNFPLLALKENLTIQLNLGFMFIWIYDFAIMLSLKYRDISSRWLFYKLNFVTTSAFTQLTGLLKNADVNSSVYVQQCTSKRVEQT